jgi:hypothetical protein
MITAASLDPVALLFAAFWVAVIAGAVTYAALWAAVFAVAAWSGLSGRDYNRRSKEDGDET